MVAYSISVGSQGSLPDSPSRIVPKPLFEVLGEFQPRGRGARAELRLHEERVQVRLCISPRWMSVPLVPPTALFSPAKINHNRPGLATFPDVPSLSMGSFILGSVLCGAVCMLESRHGTKETKGS
jgi:hypothetical protein